MQFSKIFNIFFSSLSYWSSQQWINAQWSCSQGHIQVLLKTLNSEEATGNINNLKEVERFIYWNQILSKFLPKRKLALRPVKKNNNHPWIFWQKLSDVLILHNLLVLFSVVLLSSLLPSVVAQGPGNNTSKWQTKGKICPRIP